MNFKQARRKLKKIANGKYHSIKYELTNYSDTSHVPVKQECILYIDGIGFMSGQTWEEAFQKLNNILGKENTNIEDDIPEIDDKNLFQRIIEKFMIG